MKALTISSNNVAKRELALRKFPPRHDHEAITNLKLVLPMSYLDAASAFFCKASMTFFGSPEAAVPTSCCSAPFTAGHAA